MSRKHDYLPHSMLDGFAGRGRTVTLGLLVVAAVVAGWASYKCESRSWIDRAIALVVGDKCK
jgi:hypothetical protein